MNERRSRLADARQLAGEAHCVERNWMGACPTPQPARVFLKRLLVKSSMFVLRWRSSNLNLIDMIRRRRVIVAVISFCFASSLGGNPALGAEADSFAYDWRIMESCDTMDLFIRDQHVGVLHHTFRADSLKEHIHVQTKITVQGGAKAAGASAMDLTETYCYNLSGELLSAEQELISPAGRTLWELNSDSAGEWVLGVTTGGETKKKNVLEVKDNLRSEYRMRRGIVRRTFEKGDRLRDTVFNMMAGKHTCVVAECIATPEGKEGGRWVFISRDEMLGREERLEMDSAGRPMLQEISPLFVARRRSGSEEHRRHAAAGALSDLFVIRKGLRPKGTTVHVRLDDDIVLDDSVGLFYNATDSGYLLIRLPDSCGEGGGNSGGSAYLGATVTMQVDHPEIARLAQRLKKDMASSCDIVSHFTTYVHTAIEKRNVATFSSALETHRAGFGDCGEHAVLLGALLRAAGIPARVVLGLVYVPEKRGYLYHAWVMALTGEKWVFSDPAMGRFPVAEGLIPLLIDDTGEKAMLLGKMMGRVEIAYK
ncbi:MAG: hypothetical protein GF344_12575 [Chitinivibrionales bacterium]|nr:hypothetical protein [Chitinivibrionales bacterium]MBD3357586.1 hypothetical protein [Chitinivibrionales bacterium]